MCNKYWLEKLVKNDRKVITEKGQVASEYFRKSLFFPVIIGMHIGTAYQISNDINIFSYLIDVIKELS